MKLEREKSIGFVAWLAVATMVVWATWARASQLCADPYPVGVDGYYYVVQVRSLLATGQLNYPAAPLAFFWLAPWAALFGPVAGVKLGAAAGTALAAAPAYALGRRLSGARGAGLVSAALVATSASSQFLAAEFLKQGLGLTLALVALATLAAAIEHPTRTRLTLAGLAFVATFLTHKSSFAVVVLVGAPAAWLALSARAPRWARRALWAGAGLVVLVALLGTLMPGRFPGPQDLRVVGEAFTTRAEWLLPALALPRYQVVFGHDALVALALALAALATRLVPGSRPLPPLGLGFVALALVIGLPWLDVHDVQGAAFRLRAAAFVALGPLAALVLAQLGALLEERLVDARIFGMLAALAALTLLLVRPHPTNEGQSRTHPALVAAVRALDGALPAGATVITQDRKVAFMARWYAHQAMRLHPEAHDDPARTYRLMPGFWITKDLRAALAALRTTPVPDVAPVRDLHPFDEDGLVLVPEATFRYLLAQLPPATQRYYASWPTT